MGQLYAEQVCRYRQLDGTPEYSCVIIASSSFAGAAEEAQGRLPEAGRLAPGHELRARPQTGCTSQFESM